MTSQPPFDTDGPESAAVLRYLSGESPLPEAERIRAWLALDPQRSASIDELRAAWNTPAAVPPSWDRAAVWASIANELNGSGATMARNVPSRKPAARGGWSRPNRWSAGVRGVAMASLIVALVAIAIPVVQTAKRSASARTTVREYATTSAQRLSVALTDGSSVMLAPDTRLRYLVGRDGTRTIELVGEAFFRVTHEAAHPFLVKTGPVTTRVLGTAFDVRRYPTDHATQIAVVTGRVASGGHVTPVVLAAGAVAQVTDSSVAVNVADNPERIASWTQGRLTFRDAPVLAMLTTLGRWYGYDFRLADSAMATHHVSVAFNTDKPDEALRTIEALLAVTATVDGHVVTLRPEHTSNVRTRAADVLRIPSKPEIGK